MEIKVRNGIGRSVKFRDDVADVASLVDVRVLLCESLQQGLVELLESVVCILCPVDHLSDQVLLELLTTVVDLTLIQQFQRLQVYLSAFLYIHACFIYHHLPHRSRT